MRVTLGSILALGSVALCCWPVCSLAEPELVRPERSAVYADCFQGKTASLSSEGETRLKAHLAFYKGSRLQSRGDFDGAFKGLSAALAFDPENTGLALRLAELARIMGKPQAGLQVLRESLERNESDPQSYIDLASYCETMANDREREVDEGEAEADAALLRVQALDAAQTAVAKFPSNTAAYWQLLKIYLSEASKGLAQELVSAAADRDEQSAAYWLEIGMMAQQAWPLADQDKTAAHQARINSIYEKVLASPDKNGDHIDRAADYFSQTRQYDRAVELYQEVIKLRPDLLLTREKLARIYGVVGQPEKKLEALTELVQINPHHARIQKFMGSEYEQRGNRKKAIEHYLAAVKAGESDATFFEDLITKMLEEGMTAEALPVIKRARFLYPEADSIGVLLARSYANARDWPAAMRTYRSVEKRGDEAAPGILSEAFFYEYGVAAREAKKFPRAAALFRKSISLAPSDQPERAAKAYTGLGTMWLDRDENINEAGEIIRLANELEPEDPLHLEALGWFHFKKDEPETALEVLRKARMKRETEPKKMGARLLYRLARVNRNMGNIKEAMTLLEEAVTLDDHTAEMQDLLDTLEGTE